MDKQAGSIVFDIQGQSKKYIIRDGFGIEKEHEEKLQQALETGGEK